MKRLRVALVFLVTQACASAAPLTRDLGLGLAYFRAHDLPADLPAAEGRKQACVLDLRYVRGDDKTGAAL
ncbi:MAG TPA: hypothetical protein VM029_19535, partial [Opitutaceae bacterium]|nr:hypothetical protein [Opitutaceae bacterium]